jgi:hypothetical protein
LLTVLSASNIVQSIKFWLFTDNCAAHLQGKPFLLNIKFKSYPSNCASVKPSIRTGRGYMLKRMSTSVLAHWMTMSLPHKVFPAWMSSVMITKGGDSSGGKEGDKHDLGPVTNFPEAHVTCENC